MRCLNNKACRNCIATLNRVLLDRMSVRKTAKKTRHGCFIMLGTLIVADAAAVPLEVTGEVIVHYRGAWSLKNRLIRPRTISTLDPLLIVLSSDWAAAPFQLLRLIPRSSCGKANTLMIEALAGCVP
jgi:hypothetical protein